MRVVVLRDSLRHHLVTLKRIARSSNTLPVTSHILLATDNGRLKLSATDLEMAITCWAGAQVEEEGALAVPARLFTDYVNSFPNERIDIAIAPRARQLRMACARNEAVITGMDADDFPPIPAVADGAGIYLDARALRLAIAQVKFTAATNDVRPVLTGVHALLDGQELTLAATDGFRLAVHKLPEAISLPAAAQAGLSASAQAGQRTEAIIPACTLRELYRLLADEEETAEFVINDSHVLFRLSNVEIVSQLIQGTFPNYAQLIPQFCTSRAVVDVDTFLRETRIAAIFARDSSVRLQMVPGKIIISARAEEVGDNRSEVDSQVEGEESKIAFNSRYLQEALKALNCSQVALETTGPSSPGVLRPVGLDNYVHIIMPMFVSW